MKTIRETKVKHNTLRLLETKDGYAGIVIGQNGIKARHTGTDPEAIWQTLHGEVARSADNYVGHDGARNRFLTIFPHGFKGRGHATWERDFKVKARRLLEETVPLDAALQGSGFGKAILAVYQATNLLSPFEMMRIKDALTAPEADAFIRGAARFATDDIERGLREMERALKPHDVAKWTAVTYLPFLWRPDAHMFLKPMVTREFAERVGHPFCDNYRPHLAPSVYASLLDLVAGARASVADLEPADNIDIQSYIWTVGAYGEQDAEGARAADGMAEA